eukprot:TRINITY_DN35770_c0_g1_i1.p1 TRINITY_DN35770_c0_g1~~TRINITY_DN35770_c0_g1_i1.p1  ORF type:complete len:750 (-),score=122.30 TRINITY_DN35770_c0_g1_i1:305-2491(-)
MSDLNFQASPSSSREELVQALTASGHGSFLRGWRVELDPDGTFQVGFQEFGKACARLGMKSLQQSGSKRPTVAGKLAEDKSLTLQSVSPEIDALVQRFRDFVTREFKGPEGLFSSVKATNGRVPVQELMAVCKEKGFLASDSEVAELKGCCDVDGVGTADMEELIFLESDPRLRENQLVKLRIGKKNTREHMLTQIINTFNEKGRHSENYRTTLRPWQAIEFERLPKVELQKRKNRQLDMQRNGKKAKTAFVRYIRRAFGTVVRGWRRELDPKGTFEVDRACLRRICVTAADRIDGNALLQHLERTDGSQNVCFEEIAPGPAAVLAGFQRWAKMNFGKVANIWEHPVTQKERHSSQVDSVYVASGSGGENTSLYWASGASNKKLLASSFARVLETLEWPGVWDTEQRGTLLASLDIFGCNFIARSDLEWLDRWNPPEFLYTPPSTHARDELYDHMIHKCGNLLGAWRNYMDLDESDSVTWMEFKGACKELEFEGNVAGAWGALHKDASGTMSLREFDPQIFEVLNSFKEWVELHFGSVKLLFKSIVREKDGDLPYTELKKIATRLRWEGDCKRLLSVIQDGRESQVARGGKKKAVGITFKELSFLDRWPAKAPIIDEEDHDHESKGVNHSTGESRRKRKSMFQSASAPVLPQIAQKDQGDIFHQSPGRGKANPNRVKIRDWDSSTMLPKASNTTVAEGTILGVGSLLRAAKDPLSQTKIERWRKFAMD